MNAADLHNLTRFIDGLQELCSETNLDVYGQFDGHTFALYSEGEEVCTLEIRDGCYIVTSVKS